MAATAALIGMKVDYCMIGKGLSEFKLNYEDNKGLRIEARQKLNKIKPESVGQASRISGVSPADVSVLLIYLEQLKRK